MNEAQTRAELIDPKLKKSGWGIVESSKILREHPITKGKLQTGLGRGKPLFADYVLVYKGRKLAAMEAKSDEKEVGEGVGQAKNYASKLHLETTFASSGKAENSLKAWFARMFLSVRNKILGLLVPSRFKFQRA